MHCRLGVGGTERRSVPGLFRLIRLCLFSDGGYLAEEWFNDYQQPAIIRSGDSNVQLGPTNEHPAHFVPRFIENRALLIRSVP